MNNTFQINNGIVIVSDPCYDTGIWCQSKLDNVKNGKWEADVSEVSGRCGMLTATHQNVKNVSGLKFETIGTVGVDSGQMGIFDYAFYRNDTNVPKGFKGKISDDWYGVCCEKTLDSPGWGVIDGGVVSRSGWGDGEYPLEIAKNFDDEIVGIRITFMEEYVDEDELYFEDNELSEE